MHEYHPNVTSTFVAFTYFSEIDRPQITLEKTFDWEIDTEYQKSLDPRKGTFQYTTEEICRDHKQPELYYPIIFTSALYLHDMLLNTSNKATDIALNVLEAKPYSDIQFGLDMRIYNYLKNIDDIKDYTQRDSKKNTSSIANILQIKNLNQRQQAFMHMYTNTKPTVDTRQFNTLWDLANQVESVRTAKDGMLMLPHTGPTPT